MTRFTDGEKTVDIATRVWPQDHYSPDRERDFFEGGGLPYDFVVDKVEPFVVYGMVERAGGRAEEMGGGAG